MYETINPLASPSVGTPALKYRYVNTETSSPGEAKGLIQLLSHTLLVKIINNAKINANDESNLQKISKKDIEGLNLYGNSFLKFN